MPAHHFSGLLTDEREPRSIPSAIPYDLRRFARQHLADVMQPHLLRMRRRLIAEAERFPRLAGTWYRNGPEAGHDVLAKVFSALAARQLLHVDDALVAAEQFNWLVLIPVNRAMFITQPVKTSTLQRAADRAVDTFLAAYGPQARKLR